MSVSISVEAQFRKSTYALLHVLDDVANIADLSLGGNILFGVRHLSELNLFCLKLQLGALNSGLQFCDGLFPQLFVKGRLLAFGSAVFLSRSG